MHRLRAGLAALALAAACDQIGAGHEPWQRPPGAARGQVAEREPCSHRDPGRQAWFGDLHVHTSLSFDASVWGTRLGPDDAYRFARGEPVEVAPESFARIDRPLDFAAVTDHAEWMGEVRQCTTPGSTSYESDGCQVFRGQRRSLLARVLGLQGMAARMPGIVGLFGRLPEVCGPEGEGCRASLADAWGETRAAAERHYDRSSACRFTTFHAWEYSASPERSKVHRNVILRSEVVPEIPISWIDTPTAPELWRKLDALCNDQPGCEALAIPHNPNRSNGKVFELAYLALPEEDQADAAALRARLEPVVEVTQIKGDSECRVQGGFGAPDELCAFEKMREMPGVAYDDCGEGTGTGGAQGRGCLSRRDMVRPALVEGLREQQRLGTNPLAFGLIGSTDTHTATPGAVSERTYPGSQGPESATSAQRLALDPEDPVSSPVWRSPGGLAGIWAEENSREALFDALRRREVFATSGPRIRPRLVAGFGLPRDLCTGGDFSRGEAAGGVPMGGDMPAHTPGTGALRIAVAALRDPGTVDAPGGLLQRIQVIKGWVGADGTLHERVVDVAGGPNDADVDPATCAPRGPGAEHLCAVWEDEQFDPAEPAVYYARVLENPSCRWTTWECLALPPGERPPACGDPRIPVTLQERAWTSPVWYQPGPS